MALLTPARLAPFVAATLAVAFFGATQDIAVDAYRIEIAPIEAQGALVATYSLGYRIGLLLAGAVALIHGRSRALAAGLPGDGGDDAACRCATTLMAREPVVMRHRPTRLARRDARERDRSVRRFLPSLRLAAGAA